MTRTSRVCALAVTVSVLAAGCATIPDHGSVQTIEGERSTPDAPARIKPALPGAGATPAQVATGFLLAMMASPVRYDIARRFLTSDAAADWKPGLGTTIYSQSALSSIGTGEDTEMVALTYKSDAGLSERGRYVPVSSAVSGKDRSAVFKLDRVDGQWRISNPPKGVLISREFFEGYYLPLNLYFFDHQARQVLADPIYVPDGDQVSTALMTSLLRGPEGLLADQAQTFIPSYLKLDVSVPVRADGVADVKLSGRIADLPTRDREKLAAQIIWTIGQDPAVTGVQITVDGSPLAIPGIDAVESLDTWDRFDTSATKGRGQLFALRNGRLVVLDGSTVTEFAGPWGDHASNVVDFRVDPRLTKVAVVPAGRELVRTAPLTNSNAAKTVFAGANVLRPIWDAAGNLWVVDRTSEETTLSILDGKSTRKLPIGPLAGMVVTSFELSPDNSRFVAVAHPRGKNSAVRQVFVGELQRDPKSDRAVGLTAIYALPLSASGLSGPLSAAWRSATSIAVLASLDGSYPQAFTVGIDGSTVSGASLTGDAVLPEIGATAVVSSGVPGASIYVADRAGRLWLQNPEGRWQQISDSKLGSANFPG